MPVECAVAVVDPLSILMGDEHAAIAKGVCPDFTYPCPRIVTTNFTFTLFGALFQMGWTTDLPTKDHYRQRQVVGGIPGAWSPWLPFFFSHETTYDLIHLEADHRVSNKANSSVWDYQIYEELEEIPVYRETWPACGTQVIRVQYATKTDPGGGVVLPNVPEGE